MDSHEVRDNWAARGGEYSPDYYAHYGPDETSEALLSVLDRSLDGAGAVLEPGCSSGRHLAHLLDNGYTDLTGIEVNGDAFDVMAETYPDLAAAGTFHHTAIEDVVEGFDDGAFDAVFSVETLQHIHPEAEWVFAELARVTDDVLVTVENEGDGPDDLGGVNYVKDGVPLYYRDWQAIFTDLGMTQVDHRRGDRDEFRVFRWPDA